MQTEDQHQQNNLLVQAMMDVYFYHVFALFLLSFRCIACMSAIAQSSYSHNLCGKYLNTSFKYNQLIYLMHLMYVYLFFNQCLG